MTTDVPMAPAPAPTSPASIERSVPAGGLRLNVEAAAWAAALLIAAAWRLLGLGGLLPGTRESVRAFGAWQFARGGAPAGWAGDLASALAALTVRLGGDSIAWVRLWPALFGLGSVAALALFRPYAGRAVPLLGALLLASSPVAVAAARTLSPDTAGLLCGLLILWLALRVGEEGDRRAVLLLGAVGGVALTTSAIAIAIALIAAMWVALETAWLTRSDAARHWRDAIADRALLGQALALALPGVALGVLRFGGGASRLALPAFADWAGADRDAALALPWHTPLTVLIGYEPLVLVLGIAGIASLIARWRRAGVGALTPFERLLLVWAVGGALLTLAVLHQRPGQVLLLVLPLALLAATATAGFLPALTRFRPRESGLPLLPVALVLGYATLQALAWGRAGVAPNKDVLATVGLLAFAAAVTIWALSQSRAALSGALVAGAWLLFGPLGLHGVSAVGFRGGAEFLTGQRPLPSRAALVQVIRQARDGGQDIAVDRALAAALAWDVRGVQIRTFVGLPPENADLTVQQVIDTGAVTDAAAAGGASIPVEQRWTPEEWNFFRAVRWFVNREPWGPADTLSGQAVQRASSGLPPGG